MAASRRIGGEPPSTSTTLEPVERWTFWQSADSPDGFAECEQQTFVHGGDSNAPSSVSQLSSQRHITFHLRHDGPDTTPSHHHQRLPIFDKRTESFDHRVTVTRGLGCLHVSVNVRVRVIQEQQREEREQQGSEENTANRTTASDRAYDTAGGEEAVLYFRTSAVETRVPLDLFDTLRRD
ncbi:hypothetical protein Slin15195_G129890 [Septoria linicola]|uniref:Uncharacterized protein n=1 Tax=Septoria linicola TaxID=215465 RepID=A0A9Q9ER09_9PEZI|nr:hypothetical protein Slin14017_G128910 [Septoria linicola]USW59670.1 hypothetical protein Slin15195_G129890 [Septoria linicola]